ncbi:MAG: hypothetical protein JXA57_08860 [Armatimonadetes bacterium]|nr:hypothetical protein [Armatimonadota bacterium]
MRLDVLLATCLAACLLAVTSGTAAARPSATPAEGALISPSPPQSKPLVLDGIAVEPRWDHTTAGMAGQCVTLAIELRLSNAPEDWVQISAAIPPEWKAAGQRDGWTSWYFLSNSRSISFEMELQELKQTDRVSEFPVLVQAGNRSGWLRVYLEKGDHGFCSAITRVDERGRPRWFKGESADGSDRAYWSLGTTISEALAFVGDVLGVDIHPPSYLSPWCGVGVRSDSPRSLIEVVSARAGCIIEDAREDEYVIDFAPGYIGKPDASWFVLIEHGRVRIFGDRGVAADELVAALLEAVGARLAASPDLAESTVYCSWNGSFRGALEALCEGARPALTWEENSNGEYIFSRRSQPHEVDTVALP